MTGSVRFPDLGLREVSMLTSAIFGFLLPLMGCSEKDGIVGDTDVIVDESYVDTNTAPT